MNLNSMTYGEKLAYIAQHGKRGTYTPDEIDKQIKAVMPDFPLTLHHDIADAVIRQIQQEERAENTARRRSQGAKDGWAIRRGKQQKGQQS